MTPTQNDEDETLALVAELEVFAQAYLDVEAAGGDVRAVRHAGWRPGARTGGILLAHKDTGPEALCHCHPGRRTLFSIMRRGWGRNFDERPFHVWNDRPELAGALAPGVVRVELVGPDRAVRVADVVDGTFAVAHELDLPAERALAAKEAAGTATREDRVDAVFHGADQVWEALREFSIRLYDESGTVVYDGPLRR
ncbi:hypothetical protein JOF53_002118 [Crossiella equi]|uniref:Uncharacterized protein n=1 Tax=Crossiella equi TaxID=130796 RepID=A0ABS5A9K0_9PSEU|nr:hypothetical protein [Crossiella equi]MBP2473246.1 hypothetical protein [Crossiella equi]